MSNKIGVVILSGFLGSGKTTLLRQLVHNEEIGPQIAVLINEFGEIGLDQELVKKEQTTASLHIKQLSSGCICCTVSGSLFDALQELRERMHPQTPERILIETSGISRASELSYAINALSAETPFYTDSVVTMVDAKYAKRAYQEQPEIFLDQVRSADLILLNKQDLVPGGLEKNRLETWLRPLAPRASFLWTTQAKISLPLLLGLKSIRISKEPTLLHPHNLSQDRFVHDLNQITLPLPKPIAESLLEEWLLSLADRVFRIKGIVDLIDSSGHIRTTVVQAVGDMITFEEASFDAPKEKRYLVFIGAALQAGDVALPSL